MMMFNKEKIGRLANFGGEHLVYLYGDDKVIKFPNFLVSLLFDGNKYAFKKARDLSLGKKYFNEFLVETKCYLTPGETKPYYLIQPLVKARPLVDSDLNDKHIKTQFFKIIEINKALKKQEGLSFDFYGARRMFFGYLFNNHRIDNLLLAEDENIIIVDVVFMEYNNCDWSKLLCLISRWANTRQEILLNKLKKYG